MHGRPILPNMSNSNALPEAIKKLLGSPEAELLKIYDDLRTSEFSEELREFLPHIVVCGDTSSGKSSTLEAITEVEFPKASGVCTRFATEIRMRRDSEKRATTTIIPSLNENHDAQKTKELERFEGSSKLDDLSTIIESASKAMGVVPPSGKNPDKNLKNFTEDVLIIEMHGPDMFDLTLVDLPGIIQVDPDNSLNVEKVRDINRKHIGQNNAIVLAIIDANNDLQNQAISNFIKEADSDCKRTIPVLTKLDRVDEPSEKKRWIERVLEGSHDDYFNKAFHAIRNAPETEREQQDPSNRFNGAQNGRNLREEKWFNEDEQKMIKDTTTNWGVENLRVKLQKMLAEKMRESFDTVVRRLLLKMTKLDEELRSDMYNIGDSREMRADFRDKMSDITVIASKGDSGNENDSFFNLNDYEEHVQKQQDKERQDQEQQGQERQDQEQSTGQGGSDALKDMKRHPKHLVSKINDAYTDFEQSMRNKGHRAILAPVYDKLPIDSAYYIQIVKEILKDTRGDELQLSFNPERINKLFESYSSGWIVIANDLVGEATELCREYLETVLQHHFPERHSLIAPKEPEPEKPREDPKQKGDTLQKKDRTPPSREREACVALPNPKSFYLDKFMLYKSPKDHPERDSLENRKSAALEEVKKLEEDRMRPIRTRNKYPIEQLLNDEKMEGFKTFNKANYTRNRLQQNAANQNDSGYSSQGSDTSKALQVSPDHNLETLARSQCRATEGDIQYIEAGRQLRKMLMYYEVALETYIDNVIHQVIDRHLLKNLHRILKGISSLSDEEIDKFWENGDFKRRKKEKEDIERKLEKLNKVKTRLEDWRENYWSGVSVADENNLMISLI